MTKLNDDDLMNMEKSVLVEMIEELKYDLSKANEDFMRITNLRLYLLERNQNMALQYNRRESFEISGIPQEIHQDKLEDEVLEIVKEAKVQVNRQPLKKSDIVACHRVGKKGNVVCRVINRKYAREAIINSKNLKGTKRYNGNAIYINSSFCPEFKFINYVCRTLARNKAIFRYKVRNGINLIQKDEGGKFKEIGHVNDITNLGLTVPPRQY